MSTGDRKLSQRTAYWEKRRELQSRLADARAALLDGNIPVAKRLFLESRDIEGEAQHMAAELELAAPSAQVAPTLSQSIQEKYEALVQGDLIDAATIDRQFQGMAEIEQALSGGEPAEADAMPVSVLFEKSKQALKSKQFDRAEEYLNQVLERDRDNAEARAALFFVAGSRAQQQGRLLRAHSNFQRVPASSTYGHQAGERARTIRSWGLIIGGIVSVLLLLVCVSIAYAQLKNPVAASATAAPTTALPTSAAAGVLASTTALTTTAPPATDGPTTDAPATAPATDAPTTEAPTTAPATDAPTTEAPTTAPSVTAPPAPATEILTPTVAAPSPAATAMAQPTPTDVPTPRPIPTRTPTRTPTPVSLFMAVNKVSDNGPTRCINVHLFLPSGLRGTGWALVADGLRIGVSFNAGGYAALCVPRDRQEFTFTILPPRGITATGNHGIPARGGDNFEAYTRRR